MSGVIINYVLVCQQISDQMNLSESIDISKFQFYW